MFFHGIQVALQIAARKNATVNFGVQSFYATIHNFRKAGVAAYFFHDQAFFSQQFGSSACGQYFHTAIGQRFGQLKNAGFVGHAQQRAFDGWI